MAITTEHSVGLSKQGEITYTYFFEENYIGHAPSYLWFPAHADPHSRCVQEFAYKHGTDIILYGSFKNIMVRLGVYKHDKNIREDPSGTYYHLFRWIDQTDM